MFLSYVELDMANPWVRKGLANAYEMHRTILSAFEQTEQTPRQEFGILYRVMAGDDIKLYVLHESPAMWEKIHSKGFSLYDTENNPKDITHISSGFTAGARFGFDILCAPTKKIKREGKLSHRQFIKTTEERLAWLAKKAEQNGFTLVEGSVFESGQEKIAFKKDGCAASAQAAVHCKGELIVTEETAFRQAFANGIGSGKAFGLGMLMLFPKRR